jgi:catechol 2,3-dioxygenase-like lactoylglutathione lyase family enzyme
MLTTDFGFNGFSVKDIDEARDFYEGRLGLTVTQNAMGILELTLPGGAKTILYPKDDHVPATFTVLNFEVEDIDQAVAQLAATGITLENYGGYADENGVMRGRAAGMGPDIAWFLDPSGNILSVLSN